MTKNFFDGPPSGAWATAARSPQGEVGVAIGDGAMQIGFVPEQCIPAFIAAGLKFDASDDDLLALVIDAAKTLPAFKAARESRMAKHRAAPNN